MQHLFVNEERVLISGGEPGTVRSSNVVDLPSGATVTAIEIKLDINHTWTSDLEIQLIAPDGTRVSLANRNGGSRDDFRGTIFRSDASIALSDDKPPYRGTYLPAGDLTTLNGKSAAGEWILEVKDVFRHDGGSLNSWSIGLDTSSNPSSGFQIDVRFVGGLSVAQQNAFQDAANRWAEIITGDLPPVIVESEEIDDLLILAEGKFIDGPGRVLGQAGPTHLRPGSFLPAKGIMSFDSADLDQMEADGSLTDVILHEMGHVAGFGTMWERMGLIVGAGSANPGFVGANAMREYAELSGRASPVQVPVANTGGQGTRDGHWRESVFGDELLTGFISGQVRPISRMSIASFEDMGYQVNYDAANAYALPTALNLAEMGIFSDASEHAHHEFKRTDPVVLPPSAVVNQ